MFLYKFYCRDCDEDTDEFVKMGTQTHPCEHCGAIAHRIISAPNLVFKGSGWIDKEMRQERERRKKNEKKD